MISDVHLTGNELAAASSVAAAVAIIGGYLGVRSANRNALKIAREARSSRRKDEMDALKRTVYARCLTALFALTMASEQFPLSPATNAPASLATRRKRLDDALVALYTVSGEIQLIAPNPVRVLAAEAMKATAKLTDPAYNRAVTKLRVAMRFDLQGTNIPSPGELDRMADEMMPDKEE